MPPRPFVNDALWRCLCPGFPSNASPSTIARISPTSALRRLPAAYSPHIQQRGYKQSDVTAPHNNESFPRSSAPSFSSGNIPKPQIPRKPGVKIPLARLPTNILYEHLRDAGAKGHHDEVLNICRILVKDRGEPPNKQMYNGIIHSFVSASNGTAGKLRKVLEEMGFWADVKDDYGGQYKIDLDARGCECALEVLAVHPDYLLRAEILDYMKLRWLPLTDRGRSFVVAGMLRERNFEHALETLEAMVNQDARVEPWLFDHAMWTLLEFGETEEAFHVLALKDGTKRRQNGTGSAKLSSALWGALLDAAARQQLYEPVSMVWNIQVQPGYLKPGTGACLSVLALAARYGDVHLATDVFRVLTARETIFTTHHYELLIQTHLNANDLSAALSVISIMADTKLKVDAGTCNPLFVYLRREKAGEPSRPMAAFYILQDFEASGRKVPTAAINACMQASIALKRFEEAIEIYKALHTVSHSGPNTQTFNTLFQGCHQNNRKELAMFFANEMIQLQLKPDRLTYDRLISVSLESGDLEDALLYYQEMRSTNVEPGSTRKMQPRRMTWEALIYKCVKNGDERAVALLKDYKRFEDEPRRPVEKAVKTRFEEPVVLDQLAASGDSRLLETNKPTSKSVAQDVAPSSDTQSEETKGT
ncbi:hypothetical protein DE146DRAFT_208839 [Phaeosphaeria sp. MPI-PUGE-AT-0046c]|nr:hypothetical protein DE146DRAFT_208839 [Phaeosphaeria sp. MPI-PUGE-AT-0046c]